jgi:hypothetical protein
LFASVVAVIAIAAETTTSRIGTALAHGGPMALPSGTYAPRDPAASVLYQVVRDHYQTFLAEASQLRDGEGLPRFVDEESAAFLRCGWLAPSRCAGPSRPTGRPCRSGGSRVPGA